MNPVASTVLRYLEEVFGAGSVVYQSGIELQLSDGLVHFELQPFSKQKDFFVEGRCFRKNPDNFSGLSLFENFQKNGYRFSFKQEEGGMEMSSIAFALTISEEDLNLKTKEHIGEVEVNGVLASTATPQEVKK